MVLRSSQSKLAISIIMTRRSRVGECQASCRPQFITTVVYSWPLSGLVTAAASPPEPPCLAPGLSVTASTGASSGSSGSIALSASGVPADRFHGARRAKRDPDRRDVAPGSRSEWRCDDALHCTNGRSAWPFPRRIEIDEAFDLVTPAGIWWCGTKLGIRVVVAHAWTGIRGFDAEPVQHGKYRGGFQCGLVVAVQDEVSPARHARLPPARCVWPVGRHDRHCQLHAPRSRRSCGCRDIEDHVEIEPPSLDLCRQNVMSSTRLRRVEWRCACVGGRDFRGGCARLRRFI